MIYQYSDNTKVRKNLPGLNENVTHHSMKRGRPPLQNITERVDMTLIYIKECIGGELCALVFSGTPFMEGSIQLVFQVSIIQIALVTLTAVATSATIGIGTWRIISPLPL